MPISAPTGTARQKNINHILDCFSVISSLHHSKNRFMFILLFHITISRTCPATGLNSIRRPPTLSAIINARSFLRVRQASHGLTLHLSVPVTMHRPTRYSPSRQMIMAVCSRIFISASSSSTGTAVRSAETPVSHAAFPFRLHTLLSSSGNLCITRGSQPTADRIRCMDSYSYPSSYTKIFGGFGISAFCGLHICKQYGYTFT